MLTAITYYCDRDSLGDVEPEAFVDAFENEIRVKPLYRDLAVTVKFTDGESYTEFVSDDFDADILRDDELTAEFNRFAEKAFRHCCK